MFTTPGTPNLADFATFVTQQGVPPANLPSGSLTTVSIATSGALTAASASGTVEVGMILYGTGVTNPTYLTAWNGTTLAGTVSPAPTAAINATTLTTYSEFLWWAFAQAQDRVRETCSNLYVLAVYNLGMHLLMSFAIDPQGVTPWFTPQNQNGQFVRRYNLDNFTGGVIQTGADQNTSQTVAVPELLKNLSLSNLEELKTPWGRKYLGYAQNYGPYEVGMT
jgi:hypothetical protein